VHTHSLQDDGFAGSCSLTIPDIKVDAKAFSFNLPRLKFTATVHFQICTDPMGVKLTIKEETNGLTLPSITRTVNMPQKHQIPIEIQGSSVGVPGSTITVKLEVKLSGNTIADLQIEVLLTDICVRPEGSKAGGTFDICLTKLEDKVKSIPVVGSRAWNNMVPSQTQKIIDAFPFTLVTLATADYGVACRAKPNFGKPAGNGGGGGGAAAAAIVVVLLLLFIGGAAAFVVKTRRCGVVALYMPSTKVAPTTGGRITEGMLRYRRRGRCRGEWEIGANYYRNELAILHFSHPTPTPTPPHLLHHSPSLHSFPLQCVPVASASRMAELRRTNFSLASASWGTKPRFRSWWARRGPYRSCRTSKRATSPTRA
jgi:hypothetical protein